MSARLGQAFFLQMPPDRPGRHSRASPGDTPDTVFPTFRINVTLKYVVSITGYRFFFLAICPKFRLSWQHRPEARLPAEAADIGAPG